MAMTQEDALKAILDEPMLSPMDRNVLQVLVYRCDYTHTAHISLTELEQVTGNNRKTIKRTIEYLETRGYLAKIRDSAYRPFPYVKRPSQGKKEHVAHRLVIRVHDAVILRDDCQSKIAELTALIEVAQGRKDKDSERKWTAELDYRFDLIAQLDKFIEDFKDDLQKPAEYYLS